MNSILILVGVLAAGAGVLYFLMRTGRVADQNGNMIPDQVENAVRKSSTTSQSVSSTSESTLPDLTAFTKNELISYAKDNEIKVNSRSRKVDILDTILSTQTPENN